MPSADKPRPMAAADPARTPLGLKFGEAGFVKTSDLAIAEAHACHAEVQSWGAALELRDKEERMEGVYLVKVSYQLHFKQGIDQLQVLHDEDLIYDRVGPFQQEMGLMELERKYGAFEAGQVLPQEAEVWMMKGEQGWQLAEPAR